MAESIKCILEVYDAATYSLTTPRRYLAGVVGDDISFVVTPSAVGGYTGTVEVELTGAPAGAVITYLPTGAQAMDTAVTITIDTDDCTGGDISTMTITEKAA